MIIFQMSRVCCDKLGLKCAYHNEYNSGGGDSYKVESEKQKRKKDL